MKKYFTILGLLVFLISLVFGDTFDASTASAQDDANNTKISGLLALQVEAKLRSLEAKPLEEGRVDILQAMQAAGAEVMPLNKQRVFIYSVDKLSQSQIEELDDMGLTLYRDSWIPPVNNYATGFIIADMPLDKLRKLASKNYVIRLDTAEQFLEPHNDLAAQKINADDVWSANYTGANITIAVLDSGLDVTHNDIPAPIESKDYSDYPLLDGDIANQVTGHGTHVTGSALGRGNQSSGVYKGMAPDANLVFLKIGDDDTGSAPIPAMVNAIKAAVDTYNADIITMSYGRWDSYHDGTSQEAQAVDYAVSQGAVVFISAGNYANDEWHYSDHVSANSTTGYIQVDVTNAGIYNTALYFNLVWYDGPSTSNDLEMEYYSDNYTLLTSANSTQSESSRGTESELSFYYEWVPSGNSTYFLKVKNNSANSQFFHIYYDTELNKSGAGSVKFDSADANYTIGTPADADDAIAVGAYTTREYWWNYTNSKYPEVLLETVDQISTFSSRGPRLDSGAPPKPNIVAPGSAIISTRDTDIYTWPSSYNATIIDNDGPNTDNTTKNNGNGPADYFVMQGTSMASPLAAGVAALLLEKHPSWTPAQVKLALEITATDKGAPGHDNIYGWGLLDALAASNADLIPPTMESITEPEGQYYNMAPIFSNFGFDDDVDLDDGWYQMDSYNGSWAVLFTNVAGTLWDSDNWSIPGFNELAEGSHTIYFKASDNAGNVEGEAGEWKWQFYKDITPPTYPTGVNSNSQSLSTWSSNNTIQITWTDAIDNLSGLNGYSILWNTGNLTIPD
ncbi:MAG: S8 family serine peptidase, partial [Dehalococcoidia bacterium]